MEVVPVSIIRGAYLNRFMDVLIECGLKLEMGLRQFHLPTNSIEISKGYVPVREVLSFLTWVGASARVKNLGARAASRMRLFDLDDELRTALMNTSNLEDALGIFCEFAYREQSNVRYTMAREQDSVRICSSHSCKTGASTNPYGEWLQIMPLLAVIRYFAGGSWVPSTIACRARRALSVSATCVFPNTRILEGQEKTSIVFPVSLLRISATGLIRKEESATTPDKNAAALSHFNWSLPTSLRALARTYLELGCPTIKLAAEISGVSVSTLQRQLDAFGLTYTDIVQQVRLERAKGLLTNPRVKIIDTALAVGYDDPSHFSRAFKRLAGLTPRQYRSICFAQ